MTLTGTERAALRLALGLLRSVRGRRDSGWRRHRDDPFDTAISDANEILGMFGGMWDTTVAAWVRDEETLSKHGFPSGRPMYPPRILRARLALWIRATLRAERCAFGYVVCNGCREPLPDCDPNAPCGFCPVSERNEMTRLARPLWVSAAEKASGQ